MTGRRFPLRHCANSGAVLSWRDKGAALDLVRPGLLTYGVYPDSERGGLSLTPVMALKKPRERDHASQEGRHDQLRPHMDGGARLHARGAPRRVRGRLAALPFRKA